MNKAELVDVIASKTKFSKADSAKAVEAFVQAVSKSLKKGERVMLIGFGTFSVTKRAARKGRNPQNGKPLNIPAKKVAKFKPGAELSKLVSK